MTQLLSWDLHEVSGDCAVVWDDNGQGGIERLSYGLRCVYRCKTTCTVIRLQIGLERAGRVPLCSIAFDIVR